MAVTAADVQRIYTRLGELIAYVDDAHRIGSMVYQDPELTDHQKEELDNYGECIRRATKALDDASMSIWRLHPDHPQPAIDTIAEEIQ